MFTKCETDSVGCKTFKTSLHFRGKKHVFLRLTDHFAFVTWFKAPFKFKRRNKLKYIFKTCS